MSQIYISSLHFPYTTGRNLLFRLIVCLCCILFCLIRPIKKPVSSLLPIAGVALLISVGLSDLFGADPYKSMWSSMERMQGFVSIIHYVAYFLILSATVCAYKKRWAAYLGVLASVSLFVAMCGIYDVVISGEQYFSAFFGNKSYAASYLLFGLFFTLFLAKKTPRLKYLCAASILVHMYAIYLTGNRGTMIAVCVSTYLGLSIYWLRRRIAIAFILAGMAGGLYFAATTPNFIKNERVHIWKVALRGVAERPLLGWGQENFDVLYDKHSKISRIDPPGMLWWDSAHNIFITALVGTGLMGLVFFLIFCFIAGEEIYTSNELDRRDKIVWMMVAVAFFVKAMFVFEILSTSVGLCVFMAHIWSLNSSSPLKLQFPVRIVAVMLSVIFLYYAANEARAYSRFAYLISCQETMRYKIDGFKNYFANPPMNVDYTRQFFLAYTQAVSTVNAIPKEYKKELYGMALNEIELAIKSHPGQRKLKQIRADFIKLVKLD